MSIHEHEYVPQTFTATELDFKSLATKL